MRATPGPEVVVTPADELGGRLRREAARRDVPVAWLTAGWVHETLEARGA
jgi:hypothetical protein